MLSRAILKIYNWIKISGIVALVGGLTGATISYLKHPSFEPYWPVISDFGVYVSSAIWFNTSAVLTGIFLIIFWLGYSDHKAYSKKEQLMLTLPALGIIGIGLFPADYGDCFLCLKRVIHWSFAIIFLLGLLISVISVSLNRWQKKNYRLIAIVSVFYILFGVLLFFLTYSPQYGLVIVELYFAVYAIVTVMTQSIDWLFTKQT